MCVKICCLSLTLCICTCFIFSYITFILFGIRDPRKLLLISSINCHVFSDNGQPAKRSGNSYYNIFFYLYFIQSLWMQGNISTPLVLQFHCQLKLLKSGLEKHRPKIVILIIGWILKSIIFLSIFRIAFPIYFLVKIHEFYSFC